ncbi:hypothetical protein BDM02DRAFT_3110278 [Thelephora ganbajun]|uniref:Uncharacterized protein n=1 Tax=Thelephora ganbajun TaxID=370292 RepID=A0ACB6ZQT9_THEGA|nr:hypothetical protein BDM02DRAFT_3110278 [Thelephora ganbajun]
MEHLHTVALVTVLCVFSPWLYRCTNNRPNRKPPPAKPLFEYPAIEPCTQELSQIKPTPYRPFKWGVYHVTMGIRTMDWHEWIELDREFEKYYRIRCYRIRAYGEKVVRTLDAQPGVVPSGHSAAREVIHELAEYLIRRYPHLYSVTRHDPSTAIEAGWYGKGPIRTITLRVVGRTLNLDHEDPMTTAAFLVQDDLAILLEGSDGRYYLQAGAIIVPGTWRLEDKAGMPLDEIHESGDVPLYRERLHLSLGRFIKRLPVDKPVVRNNYTFQVVDPTTNRPDDEKLVDRDELGWLSTMMGEEFPDSQIARHGECKRKLGSTVTPEMIILRTERQTLRRLPKTGAILFTIRTYTTPVVELVQEPGIPSRLASAVRSWPDVVAKYKSREAFGEVLLSYLDEWATKQAAAGIVDTDEKGYPF